MIFGAGEKNKVPVVCPVGGRRRGGKRLFRAGKCGLDQRRAFATSVAVIAPLCALSAAVYWLRGQLDFMLALPYLAGGLIGGWVGGKVFKKLSMVWLRRGFALLILYGGVRAFL